MPKPPLARDHTVVAYPHDTILAYYPSLDAFAAAFDEVEDVNGCLVCARGRDATDFAAHLFEGNWHLARLAKPGETEYLYVLAPKTPKERAEVDAQPDRLHWNGYRASDQAHAFTAALEPGEHLSARDIMRCRTWLFSELDDDDRPVQHIRIFFPDRATALQERRPLLDVGCEVLYLADDGEYVPVPVE